MSEFLAIKLPSGRGLPNKNEIKIITLQHLGKYCAIYFIWMVTSKDNTRLDVWGWKWNVLLTSASAQWPALFRSSHYLFTFDFKFLNLKSTEDIYFPFFLLSAKKNWVLFQCRHAVVLRVLTMNIKLTTASKGSAKVKRHLWLCYFKLFYQECSTICKWLFLIIRRKFPFKVKMTVFRLWLNMSFVDLQSKVYRLLRLVSSGGRLNANNGRQKFWRMTALLIQWE